MTLLLLRDQSRSEHEGKSGHSEERNFKELGIVLSLPIQDTGHCVFESGRSFLRGGWSGWCQDGGVKLKRARMLQLGVALTSSLCVLPNLQIHLKYVVI